MQYTLMSTWLYYTSQLCFYPETERKFTRVDNSPKDCKIHIEVSEINSPKKYLWKKQVCKECSAHNIACTAHTDDKSNNNNNNTDLFFLLLVNNSKVFLKFT